jgi:DNA invertase Pin-like site-specific DNA recombinase
VEYDGQQTDSESDQERQPRSAGTSNGKHDGTIGKTSHRVSTADSFAGSPSIPDLSENQTMKAIGYTRCSTNEQADSGLGMDVQAERIKAYCTMRNLDLLDTITDAGVSGGKPLATRDGGQRLLCDLKEKRADAVVMLKLDRMFRNAGDCLTTVERWEKSGVALHVIDLGGNAIDTTSAAGRFMLVVLAGAAEMERNLTRERTRSAMAVKRSNGQRIGTVPYGFDLADDGETLISNEHEQTVMSDIRVMRSRGMKLQEIADALTERSVATKTGKSDGWTHQAVARILARTV